MIAPKRKQVKMTYDEKEGVKKNIRYYEFDCPLCAANNPLDEGFKPGEEVTCLYCGSNFRVKADSDGFMKLIPI